MFIPDDYKSTLNIIETEEAIKLIKDTFEELLAEKLNLKRISAPLFVRPESGLNDNLSGVERPVQFDISDIGGDAQIVHSLAKWKRMALHNYDFEPGTGLYTDMNAIRRDETLDNTHSVYVDQWDWECVITKSDRNSEFLIEIVAKIFEAITEAEQVVCAKYRKLTPMITPFFHSVTAQQLEDMYPDLTQKEREDAICREHGSVFLMNIGGTLKSGEAHDSRSPDYDDWSLNGDILIWYEPLGHALELSSMGIRVDSDAMDRQLKISNSTDRASMPFHKMVLEGKLPYTIGGGIGQSRLCMVLLGKIHVGEVQCSIWPDKMIKECKEKGVFLL